MMLAVDLDIEQTDTLLAYLWQQGVVAAGVPHHTKKLDGGVSNRTMLVEYDTGVRTGCSSRHWKSHACRSTGLAIRPEQSIFLPDTRNHTTERLS